MNLKMVLKGDGGPILESNDMFQLSDIKNAEVITTDNLLCSKNL